MDIFVRTNTGGTPLTYSDILMSIAVAEWSKYGAREETYSLVDDINEIGRDFRFSKDFVLKSCLMLSDLSNIGFRVDNFSRSNMSRIQAQWIDIKSSVRTAVQLAAGFGLSGPTLTATNSLLPIAYFVHRHKCAGEILDRANLRTTERRSNTY